MSNHASNVGVRPPPHAMFAIPQGRILSMIHNRVRIAKARVLSSASIVRVAVYNPGFLIDSVRMTLWTSPALLVYAFVHFRVQAMGSHVVKLTRFLCRFVVITWKIMVCHWHGISFQRATLMVRAFSLPRFIRTSSFRSAPKYGDARSETAVVTLSKWQYILTALQETNHDISPSARRIQRTTKHSSVPTRFDDAIKPYSTDFSIIIFLQHVVP